MCAHLLPLVSLSLSTFCPSLSSLELELTWHGQRRLGFGLPTSQHPEDMQA